jgi:hypothetical protein
VRYERLAENFLGHVTAGQLPHSVAGFMRCLLPMGTEVLPKS